MADPLSPAAGPPGAPAPPRIDREARRQRLVQAASGHRLWGGMQRPWVSWSLLLVLGLVHVALGLRLWSLGKVDLLGSLLVARPDPLLIRAGAQYAPAISEGEAWRLVSCVFLHGDGLHLFLNGMALAGLGRLCESLYGRRRLLFLFLLCGVAGSTASYLGGHRLSIGASGAIFGLMGAPIVFGWRHRAELPHGLGDQIRRSLMPWLGVNLLIGVLVPFIDNLAHVGGLVAGGLAALVMGNRVVPGREGPLWTGWALLALSLATLSAAAWGVWGQWR